MRLIPMVWYGQNLAYRGQLGEVISAVNRRSGNHVAGVPEKTAENRINPVSYDKTAGLTGSVKSDFCSNIVVNNRASRGQLT